MADAATKTPNYSDEMVERMLAMYDELGNDGLEQIAETLDRPVRSVRSKLVREGVYKSADKPAAKRKKEGPTKKEMLRHLGELVPFDVDGLMGATKEAIGHLIEYASTTVEPDVSETGTSEPDVSTPETVESLD